MNYMSLYSECITTLFDISQISKAKKRQSEKQMCTKETRIQCRSWSNSEEQFHGGNTSILAACQMSVDYSQSHHHMKAQSDTI